MPDDAIFTHIEGLQAGQPWGRVLDAGTGEHSLRWIAGLDTASWTAVTADAARAAKLQGQFARRERDLVIAGNWSDEALLHGEVFDVVVADYLLGAVDAFSPYAQDILFERLARHVGRRLLIVGLEPYDETSPAPAAGLVTEIARLRDACILLSGQRPYREFPAAWVLRQLERSGFEVEDVRRFPIVYGPRFVNGQLDLAANKLRHVHDVDLVRSLEQRIATLRDRSIRFANRHDGIRHGEDYVISARRRGLTR